MEQAARHTHFPVRQDQFRVTIRGCGMQLPGKLLQASRYRNLPPEAAQAMAQQVLKTRQRELAQGRHARSITVTNPLPVERSKLIEQAGRFGKMARRLSQRGFSGRKALAYCGQRFVAKKIAGQRRIGIALVGYPGQTFGRGIDFNFGAGNIEHWAQQTQAAKAAFDRHPGGSGHPSPPQQVEQNGLGLIAAVLGQ